jgi:hypothetical protein
VAKKNIHDEEDEFDDPGDAPDQDEELAAAGYFVENEDGMEEGKKKVEIEGEEPYFLEHSERENRDEGILLDDYSDHLEKDENEEGGGYAEKNSEATKGRKVKEEGTGRF